MDTYIYLDTARLGQMCPEAQAADRDFARLAGEEAGSLYYDLFLRGGFFGLPRSLRNRYPGLSDWCGVPTLKRRIQTALRMPAQRTVLLANRTAQLVRLACRAMCQRCENILVTDMLWPAYRKTLETECLRSGRTLTTVPLTTAVFYDRITQAELIDRLVGTYRHENCDGLMLSAVTCHGVRMPISEIVETIAQTRRPGFVAIDAAQAVNHVPLHDTAEHADFLITGTHKWLRAYHPMGLGFCCRPRAERWIGETFRNMLQRGELDDPLLRFTSKLETDTCEPFSETVNLAPLFTTTAAIGRIWRAEQGRETEFSGQLANSDRLAHLAENPPWKPLRPDISARSGILLLHAKSQETKTASPDKLRTAFRRRGIALSAYDGGLIRTALPPDSVSLADLSLVRSALHACPSQIPVHWPVFFEPVPDFVHYKRPECSAILNLYCVVDR